MVRKRMVRCSIDTVLHAKIGVAPCDVHLWDGTDSFEPFGCFESQTQKFHHDQPEFGSEFRPGQT